MMLNITEIFQFQSVIEWGSIQTPILIGLLMVVGGTGLIIKCLFINYLVRHAPRNRPINSMLLKEQALHLISTIVMGIGNLIPLITGVPLIDYVGELGCFIFRAGFALFTLVTFISGFCMALFRYILTIHNDKALKLGVDKVKMFVNITELVLYSWNILCSVVIYVYGSSPMTMAFCRNQSKMFLNMLSEHENQTSIGQHALTMASILAQMLGIMELYMYVRLYKTLYNRDQKMEKALTKEVVQSRTKRNAMTLSGQVWVFWIELITNIIIQITVNLDMDSPFLQPQMATYYGMIMSTAVSVGHFVASPDLRRFYWNFQF